MVFSDDRSGTTQIHAVSISDPTLSPPLAQSCTPVAEDCGNHADDDGDGKVDCDDSDCVAYSACRSWQQSVTLDVIPDSPYPPAVAINASGNAVAVWRQHVGTRINVYASHYDPGLQTWGTPQLLASEHAVDAGIAAAGDFVVAAWTEGDGGLDLKARVRR